MDQSLRSEIFFNESGVAGFTHRAFTKSMGFDDVDMSRPVIGICNTYSEVNNCHRHFRELAEAVKRGVWQAGGFPLEFPTISLGEIYLNPTSMLFRNLAAMDTEEMIRGQPLDGVVLLAGCDKTMPAALMGAASADLPAIMVSGGPMLNGHYQGQILGACTDCRGYRPNSRPERWTRHVSGDRGRHRAQRRPLYGHGHGLHDGLPGRGPGHLLARQRCYSRGRRCRLRLAEAAGRRIVALAREGVRPSQIYDPAGL